MDPEHTRHLFEELAHALVQGGLFSLALIDHGAIGAIAPVMGIVFGVHKGAPTALQSVQALSTNYPLPPHMAAPIQPAGAPAPSSSNSPPSSVSRVPLPPAPAPPQEPTVVAHSSAKGP